ncbi:hypothetical protein [Thermococcus sp.]|uniref:hypothetical protein n=1 Tax=Thermococcus sp. TaxID=35749 RepID=UPI00260AB944|nr:hypothetical protein [Thermococcus sp.]
MNGLKRIVSAISITVIVVLLIFGLAVPRLNIKVQELGVGECSLNKFLDTANVTIGWETTPYIFGTSIYTLKNITMTFSNNVSSANLSVLVVIYGYNVNTGSYQEDVFQYNASNISIKAGVPYVINNTNTSYSYYGGGIISKPEIKNFTVIVTTTPYPCNNTPIMVGAQGIEIASLSYSPPSSGVLNITIQEQSGSNLSYYVINFTLPGNWSKLYPYITYPNGTRLYYWYEYVPSAQKTWFWTRVNLSPYQTLTLQLHYGNYTQYNSTYVNMSNVFWMFSVSPFSISSGSSVSVGTTLFSQFLSALSYFGYDGYTVDMNANLSAPSTSEYGPYYLFYNVTGYFGLTYPTGIGIILYSSPLYRVDWVLSFFGSLVVYRVISYPTLPVGTIAQYELTITSSGNVTLTANLNEVANDRLSQASYRNDFVIGQGIGTSYYEWIGFRPYKSPPPNVTITSIQTGEYSFTVYFRP